jgi:hypothetical protein
MRMNITSNKEGYVYFNEVLFGFYKNYFQKSPVFNNGLKNY